MFGVIHSEPGMDFSNLHSIDWLYSELDIKMILSLFIESQREQ